MLKSSNRIPSFSRELRTTFGLAADDVRMVQLPVVQHRLRLQVWRQVHHLAMQLCLINELKRQIREFGPGGRSSEDILAGRRNSVDALLALTLRLSDDLYVEWKANIQLAGNHPLFSELLPRYLGKTEPCDDPLRYLTVGDHNRVHPQNGPADIPPSVFIARVVNEAPYRDTVRLLDLALETSWRGAPYDEIMLRAKMLQTS